jgi:hypothetical protein
LFRYCGQRKGRNKEKGGRKDKKGREEKERKENKRKERERTKKERKKEKEGGKEKEGREGHIVGAAWKGSATHYLAEHANCVAVLIKRESEGLVVHQIFVDVHTPTTRGL